MTLDHWQNIYKNKGEREVSWTQSYPQTAIDYILSLDLDKSASIIDIGGGTGNFADALLDLGYSNITVLDISEAALERSKNRLADRAQLIKWITSDITTFEAQESYDFWYDRAVFHFLTTKELIEHYVNLASKSINQGGHLLLGTFSEGGPKKCSGLEIAQYSAAKMKQTFDANFTALNCFQQEHITPFDTIQEFQFCGFERNG